MPEYCFCVGGLFFSVVSSVSFDIPPNFAPFLCAPPSGAVPFPVTLSPAEHIPHGELVLDTPARTVEKTKGGFFYHYFTADREEIGYAFLADNLSECRLYVLKNAGFSLPTGLSFLPFAPYFLLHGGLFFHAATVVCRKKAVAFIAPSGTGKSTQASLWETYKGAPLLNGDRILFKKEDEGFCAFGLPMAGSSFVFKNESAPLCAMVLLSQSPQNTVSVLAPDMFSRLLEQAELPLYHKPWAKQSLDLFSELVCSVPAFSFACRPDEDAVWTLSSYIKI